MIEGPTESVLGYLANHPAILNMTGFRDSASGIEGNYKVPYHTVVDN